MIGTLKEDEQPNKSVAVKTYVVLTDGETVGDNVVELIISVVGLHEYPVILLRSLKVTSHETKLPVPPPPPLLSATFKVHVVFDGPPAAAIAFKTA